MTNGVDAYALELIRTLTPWAMGLLSLIWVVIVFVFKKTFATKHEVAVVRSGYEQLEREVSQLPKKDDITTLLVAVETLNGDIKEIKTSISGLERMSHLLLENELKDAQ